MSCSGRSSPAISNVGASRGAGVEGFPGFVDPNADGVAERSCRWMNGEEACEGIVRTSTRSSTAQIARTDSSRLPRIDCVFHRMLLMPSEAETGLRGVQGARRRKRMRHR